MHKRNSHCSWCGTAFPEGAGWPRTCSGCKNESYLNPIPVTVVLLPVDDGLLLIRRGIEPKKGHLALPGGFVNFGESWQEAGAREVLEETGLTVTAAELEEFRVLSTPGQVLVFALAKARTQASLPLLVPNSEVTEMLISKAPQELAFAFHTQVMAEYFERRGANRLGRK